MAPQQKNPLDRQARLRACAHILQWNSGRCERATHRCTGMVAPTSLAAAATSSKLSGPTSSCIDICTSHGREVPPPAALAAPLG